MPRLVNLEPTGLFSPIAGVVVPASGSVDITDEQASLVPLAHGVWALQGDDGSPLDAPEPVVPEPVAEPVTEAAPVPGPPATRTDTKQGEITTPPAKETR